VDSKNKVSIIDVWAQHPTHAFWSHEMFSSLRRWIGLKEVPAVIPIEKTLQDMEKGQVSKALLCAWWGPSGPLLSNDDVAEAVQKYPDRFVGVAAVNLRKPKEAIQELRRCIKELNFKALRIIPWLWNLPPNHRYYYPLYAECVELKIPVCLQVGHTGPLCPSEPGRPIPYVDEVALDFPELTIVGGHIGYPWTQEMIALATKYPNVFIDTSAYKPSTYPLELIQFMKQHGRKKVMFGTNYPMIQPADCLEELDKLGLDQEVLNKFLFENAKTVFHL
jgi:predicted TIM-barrel fold metal-dependent hydrolase